MITPTEVLIDFTRVLDDLQIQYVVVGSFASSARGVRRATIDADIVADLTLDHVKAVVDRLSGDYYIDDLAARRAIRTQRAFNAIHLESMFKVDVHISEDSVVAKLNWYRKGNEVSDQQWSDVLGIIKVQQDRLDYSYMREWSEELGVRDLLDKAIGQAS